MPNDPTPLTERLRRKDAFMVFVASDGEKALRLMTEAERREEAADEIERLTEALEEILRVGHNDDCMFCGFKDHIATEALSDD